MTARSMLVSLGCLLAATVGAAPPSKNDYPSGMPVRASYAQPMIEIVLPDDVYRVVTRADLGDLRVFNADGMPVPHAFCAAPSSAAPQVTEKALQVFVLRGRDQIYTDGSRVAVETPSGTRVNVEESAAPAPEVVSGLIHIIDARDTQPLRAIRFDWRSPDGASEVKVRIEASDDLDQWQTIVPRKHVVTGAAGRSGIASRAHRVADSRVQVPARAASRQRPAADPQFGHGRAGRRRRRNRTYVVQRASRGVQGSGCCCTSMHSIWRQSPMRACGWLSKNSTVSVSLQSRPDEESPWRSRWTGESCCHRLGHRAAESPPAQFQATKRSILAPADPERSAGVPGQHASKLGYRPAKLRFLAQGPGPFTVAFGSRRAEPAQPAVCDGLLANMSAADRERMIEQGFVRAGRASWAGPMP